MISVGFFGFLKKFVMCFSWKLSKMKTNIATDISPPISYGPKCFYLMKFAGFFK